MVGFSAIEKVKNYLDGNINKIKNEILKQTDELVKEGKLKKEQLPEIYHIPERKGKVDIKSVEAGAGRGRRKVANEVFDASRIPTESRVAVLQKTIVKLDTAIQ